MTEIPDFGLVMRSGGVALVLDLSEGGLPAVVHWGADCGALDQQGYSALLATGVLPVAPSEVDVPVRISILPEHTRGWMGRPGLSGSRGGAAWSPLWRVTGATLDGTVVAGASAAGVVNHGAGTLVVTAADDDARLAVTLTVELSRAGIVRTRAEVQNLGEEAYQVDELLLCLPTPAIASEVLDFAGRWAGERAPQRRAMAIGAHRREGRRGRTGLDAAMILSVGTPGFGFAHGEVWGVHTAWSGNHVHQVERVLSGEQLLGGGELLLPGEVRLAQGERYESPWVYGIYGAGLDDSAKRMHRHLRARPQHPGSVRPVTLNVWEAVYFDHDVDTLLELADRAAEIGIERFVLDDGWFGGRRNDRAGLGDWTVSGEVWPDGLHPLVDRVRGLGMQFGLWFEPEMVNIDSDLARAHPEWIMATGDRLPVESRHQQVLNLGIPEAYAHVRDAMCAILDEYDIGYIKWDHNRDLVDAGTQPFGRAGVHEQTLAFYRLVDELKARYPELEIESCSSGGGRVDLGALDRTDRVWVSDNNDPIDRQQSNRWTTQLVPPELMGNHIASGASHTTNRLHALSFRAVTALFGHLGVEWDLRHAGEAELAELEGWIRLHKANRELLHGGELVRLDHPDASLSLNGIVAADGSAGLFAYVSLARASVASPGRIRLPGLLPTATYRVEPALVGGLPHGADAAPWWELGPLELTGVALDSIGVVMPRLRPEQAVLLRAVRIDDDDSRGLIA
ncbi:alpha-galactosidase [Agromyces cerinus]|uniref:Alpha-galactosidase n=1 Tax=Agromyces cerinus subsp. cerinus TaxID=232089 RepID=A0A1N6F7I6_9MICO|nr:alpha-galactosidase [Agromyces cerinus]SIN91199.1 alpha-galactosidase [Agromyces cerinus subsp. cerinus]